jgi:hypothetical protein
MLYLEYEPTADTHEPTASCTHNNTQHTAKNIKHCHHGPPKPPASSGSNFTGECNHRMMCNPSQSLQHGDVILIDKTNCSVYLPACCACWQNVSFISYYSCFFLRNCIRTMHTRKHLTGWSEHPLINSHIALFLSNCIFQCSVGWITVDLSILLFQIFCNSNFHLFLSSPKFRSWPGAVSCTWHFGHLTNANKSGQSHK